MRTKPRAKAEILGAAAALRRVHGQALGYQPLRMKPVHFATGFLLSLTGQSRRLEWLNKTTVPKAAPKRNIRGEDQYVADTLLPILQQSGSVSPDIGIEAFRTLRAHLNAAFNNDGSALSAAFPPYKTFGSDYSAPSAGYVSSQSKNHGYSGTFVAYVLERTDDGRAVLEQARAILQAPAPPLADFGSPLIDEDEEPWIDDYVEQFGEISPERLDHVAAQMARQTRALRQLADTLVDRRSTYALRHLIIGLCAWLYLYMMRVEDNEPLLLIDAQQGQNARVRTQSRASYARELDAFSQSYDRSRARDSSQIDDDDWDQFVGSDDARQMLEDHFRDLGVRIGFVQPRAPNAKRKHIELQADTLRVLALSLLKPGELIPLAEFAMRLRETWCVCTGAGIDDGDLLHRKGFAPLDADDDLEPNAAAFRTLLVRLGLAVEPSDGLTLCAIDAEELI